MSLSRVVAEVANFLTAELTPAPGMVGAGLPAAVNELPAITIFLDDVENTLTAIGARPAPTRRGALAVSRRFDLADTNLSFPDGETVDLLSADRATLHFPHGPVVGADGTEVATLTAADLTVTVDGTPLTVVTGDPTATEVGAQPLVGTITFGAALPATGELVVDFFLGEWEVETSRYQGELVVEVSADDRPATNDLSLDVEEALRQAAAGAVPGLRWLRPISLGAIVPVDDPPNSHRRGMHYRFDFELEEPILGTGGGRIDRVAVDSRYGVEVFEIGPDPNP